jgi:chromosome partitioning protein
MKTIAVISQKGGTGKTTTILNLAAAAYMEGKSVLIVDLDQQASATQWHAAREDKQLHVQPTHPAGLPELLRVAAIQDVDFVFIDTAAKTESDAADAIEVADLVLITCRPSVMDLRAMRNTIRLCQVRAVTPYFVLTQIPAQGTLREEAATALTQLGAKVLPEGLGRRDVFHHCLVDGRAVLEYEPKGKAAQEVTALYRAICQLAIKPSCHQDGISLDQPSESVTA